MQGMIGFLIFILLQIYVPAKKNEKSVRIWQNYGHKFGVSFCDLPVYFWDFSVVDCRLSFSDQL